MQYLLTQAELDELKGNKDKVLEERIQAGLGQLEKDLRPCIRPDSFHRAGMLEIDMESYGRTVRKLMATIRGETPEQKEAVRKNG